MSKKESEALGQAPPPAYDQPQQGEQGGESMGPGTEKQQPPPYAQQQYPAAAGGQYYAPAGPGGQQYPPGPQGQPLVMQPGYAQPGPGGQTMIIVSPQVMANAPSTHLNFAIFVTLCCCWPIGIFAILRASSCKSAIAQGDRVQAERLSKEAKKLSMWALIIGIIFNIISIGIVVTIYAMYIIPSLEGF